VRMPLLALLFAALTLSGCVVEPLHPHVSFHHHRYDHD
jgi:hypothetical protein